MHHRICLLALPRSGSNYCASLLHRNMNAFYTHVKEISEPYTLSQGDMIIENGFLSRTETSHDTISSMEHARHVNSIMRHSDHNQPVIMKLFIFNEMIGYSKEIIDTLTHANFKFVVNKRINIEQQLLSTALAATTDFWLSSAGFYKTQNNTITEVGFNSMSNLYRNILGFDDHISMLSAYLPVIHYETMREDIANFLEISPEEVDMTTHMEKQGTEDLYDCIGNKEEVREFIRNMLDASGEEL